MAAGPTPFAQKGPSVAPSRTGFSLIEALVVLAIGGMALAIIFSIGIKAGDTGFSLGRRAMSAADQDVAVSDLRSLIRSIVLKPPSALMDGVDQPFTGAADRLEVEAVAERATGCAPLGWAGRLVLTIEAVGTERTLYCQAGPNRTPLLTTRAPDAAFSYSLDGMTWTPSYVAEPARAFAEDGVRSQRLWVRFNGGPALDILEQASSGRPERWVRPDAEF